MNRNGFALFACSGNRKKLAELFVTSALFRFTKVACQMGPVFYVVKLEIFDF